MAYEMSCRRGQFGLTVYVPDLPDGPLRIEEVLDGEWFGGVLAPDFCSPHGGLKVTLDVVPIDSSGYLVKGQGVGTVGFACGRCLEDSFRELNLDFQLVFVEGAEGHAGGDGDNMAPEELEGDSGSEHVYLSGDEINLLEIIEEQVILALPMHPVCSGGCLGLCSLCGVNLKSGDCGCDRVVTDPRWDALKKIKL